MLELQGDRVLVVGEENSKKDRLVLTIVQLVDVDKRELILVNREEKSRETWQLTQEIMDRMTRLKGDPKAQWLLTL